MSALSTCPDCGAALPQDTPAGLCPRCLLGAGLTGQADPRLADEILAREQALAQDVEVVDALAAINAVRRVQAGLVAMPGFRISREKLEEMEAVLRSGSFSPDREGEAAEVRPPQ